jgi:hypothetical protein
VCRSTRRSCFPDEHFTTIDLATGLSYPAKAERARRNPKVGLLIEGRRDEPVVSVAGYAAVHDSKLQANAERYMAETAFSRPGNPPWDVSRKAVWYWTRIIVSVAPARVLWWDDRAALDMAPHRLEAAPYTAFARFDTAPPGTISASPDWPQQLWQDMAGEALASRIPGHLTVCDAAGFPLPFRIRDIRLEGAGFCMDLPRGAPWATTGKASLSFAGRQIFIGTARGEAGTVRLDVDRVIPMHPFVADESQMWAPSPGIHKALMTRLRHEAARRDLSIPVLPELEPEPSPGARLRMVRFVRHQTLREDRQLSSRQDIDWHRSARE